MAVTLDMAEAGDIAASLSGDGEAYARLIRRYQSEMARYLWRFTRQPAVLEELVQEVFVQAYFSLPSFRGESPFEHWLRRIATRVGYRYWRDRRRNRREVNPEQVRRSGNISDADQRMEAAELVHTVLGELPPRDRLVLTLLFLEERSVAETALLTGWSRTMVKVQAHRARSRLRKVLRQRGIQ